LLADARQVLGIQALADKSNDYGHPEALGAAGLDVTIDAMSCQKSVTQDIMRRRTGYVLALKGNHPAG
jgi:predicted transposase YbfD/YdcC